MRVELPGVHRAAADISIDFEGRELSAYPGETLAAALVAAGLWDTRATRQAEPRSLFCGMGVCGECVVLVNGETRRACQEQVRAGLHVMRHPPRAPIMPAAAVNPTAERATQELLTPDVLIVGAGPAGLAAARSAAQAGLEVLLVDERKSAGGQYFKQPGAAFRMEEAQLDAQFRQGRELAAAALAAGAELILEALVWGAFAPGEIALSTPTRRLNIRPRALVLACGAYERGVPFPGWTLPGVITTGAAQTLLRASQVTPGQRVLIAGNGPLNLQVASELGAAGVTIVALAETAPAPGLKSLHALATMARSSPKLVRDGLRHTLTLKRRGVPFHYEHALIRVEGRNRAETAVIARIDAQGHPIAGSEKLYAVDAVCMGYGFLPQSELARALGCRHHYDPQRGSLIVERDESGRTSVPQVFVVGDAGGLGGARIAMSQGVLAGAAIARELKPTAKELTDMDHCVRSARRTLHQHQRFQTALWTLYRAPVLMAQLATRDTLICRCESVSKATLDALLDAEVSALGALKRVSRAGMGRCQGRYCGPVIAEMQRQRADAALLETDFFAPRPPFRPIPIGSLAAPHFTPELAQGI